MCFYGSLRRYAVLVEIATRELARIEGLGTLARRHTHGNLELVKLGRLFFSVLVLLLSPAVHEATSSAKAQAAAEQDQNHHDNGDCHYGRT